MGEFPKFCSFNFKIVKGAFSCELVYVEYVYQVLSHHYRAITITIITTAFTFFIIFFQSNFVYRYEVDDMVLIWFEIRYYCAAAICSLDYHFAPLSPSPFLFVRNLNLVVVKLIDILALVRV